MKHLSLLAFLCLCFFSCSPKLYNIGMSETEFKKHNHNAELVSASTNTSIYRISKVVLTWTPGSKFYYFINGVLTKIDEGQTRPDIIIQNTH